MTVAASRPHGCRPIDGSRGGGAASALELVEALNALLSFEIWDILGGREGQVEDARSRVHTLVNAAIRIPSA
jgi:hypothetical protein